MAIATDLSEREARELAADFRDHATFSRESLHITDLQGSVVPLELMPGQLKLNARIKSMRRRRKPVRLVVLKTRRSMFTSGATSEMFQDVAFLPGRKGVVVADRYKPAGLEAFGYLLQYHRGYQPFTRHGVEISLPELVKDSEQQLTYANGSQMEVYSADVGEIRGGGRHWAIIDELAFWRNPGKTLPGVLNMVPKLPNTAVIVLSTANGIGGEFYELCQQAQDPNNESGWEFLFFGWLEHPIYQLPFASREDAAKFAAALNPEEKFLAQRHGATLAQLHWRRVTIATECLGSVDTFHQEYPTTPEEAFLASGRPVFDPKAVMRMPAVPGHSGELSEIEDGPIKRIIFQPGERGALTIWRRPERGRRYVIGADPSKGKDVDAAQRGRDPDYSVAFVADGDSGEQVALLRARIRPVAFAEYLALLGKWFGFAFICPESNDEGFMESLLRTGYPHDCIYEQQRNPTDKKSQPVLEFGFYTDGQSRDWLVAAAEDALRTQSIIICSQVVIQECMRFVIKPNGKKEAQQGAHDDCVIAYGLAEIGRRCLPKRTGQPRPDSATVAKIRYYGRKNRDDDDD